MYSFALFSLPVPIRKSPHFTQVVSIVLLHPHYISRNYRKRISIQFFWSDLVTAFAPTNLATASESRDWFNHRRKKSIDHERSVTCWLVRTVQATHARGQLQLNSAPPVAKLSDRVCRLKTLCKLWGRVDRNACVYWSTVIRHWICPSASAMR